MACKIIDGKLVAYQLGQLKGAERAAMEIHLKDCRDCLASFFIAKNAWDDSRECEDRPSPAVGEAIMAAFQPPRLKARVWGKSQNHW